MVINSLSYKDVNKVLISKIKEGNINEKMILNSTNYIKEEERIANGIFYTPSNIVNETHLYLDKSLGKTWKDKYTVWDSACYDDQTDVLTKDGWKLFKDLKDDDLIYSLNPYNNKAEWVGFHKRQIIPFKGKLLNFKSSRIDLTVTPDHKMFNTERKHSNDTPVKSFFWLASDTQNYLNRGNSILQTAAAVLDDKTTKTFNHEKALIIAKLYGLYIGDGYVSKNQSNNEINAINFSFSKERKINYLNNLLKELNIIPTIYLKESSIENQTHFRITDKSIFKYFEHLFNCKASTKTIPIEILEYSIETKKAILNGLINSDGHVKNNHHFVYYTSSENLAKQVEILAIELGYNTKIRVKIHSNKNHNTAFEITCINRFSTKQLKKSHISKTEYNGIVYDVTLNKNHILLVRKNGVSVFSGNCGKGNLTKDYKIKNLFLSTLEKTDIDFINKIGYNKGSTNFKYDFLNSSIKKIPEELLNSLKEDKSILFLINPPYAINVNNRYAKRMKKAGYNHYVYRLTQLQFLYRILEIKKEFNLTNVRICFIAPLSFLTKKTFHKLREDLFTEFQFDKSFLFNAKEFNVKYGNWSIGTTIFKPGKQKNIKQFKYDVFETNDKKTVYNIEAADSGLDYLKRSMEHIKKKKQIKTLPLKSALVWGGDKITRLHSPENSLGFYVVTSNNIGNSNFSFILSSQPSNSYGLAILDFNLSDIVVNFTTRKAVRKDWLNTYDECLKPTDKLLQSAKYNQFKDDCIVFAMFNQSSHQSSLRNIEYNGDVYNVNNKWFWMSYNDIRQLAEKTKYKSILKDLDTVSENSFIYDKLDTVSLSNDAKNILELARTMTADTFKYRKKYSKENPKQQLDTWDAGWQQMKPMLKKYDNDYYSNFVKTYNTFEERLKKQVFDFNLLK